MTAVPAPAPAARRRSVARAVRHGGWRAHAVRVLLILAGIAVARWLGLVAARPAHVRPYIAAALVLPAVLLGLTRPRHVVLALLALLPFLGLVRRVLSITASPQRDPLLLIAPLMVGILVFAAIRAGGFSRLGALSNSVLALCYVIVLGVINPLQGGLLIGVSGLLFTLVPVLWFWIGRAFLDDATYLRVVWLLAIVGVVVAGYGLFQTYAGFPSWDEEWIATEGYAALNVYGTIRPFASFVSAAEYGIYLCICVLVWVLLVPRLHGFAVVVAAVVGWALFLESIRGAVFALFLALGAMIAIRWRLGPLGAAALGGAALVLVSFAAGLVSRPADDDEPGTQNLIQHQLDGLANPFDNETSTADEHASLVVAGLGHLPSYPLGVGTGATSIAADVFGDEEGRPTGTMTEADLSNAAVAWGVPGVVAFLTVAVIGLYRSYRLAQDEGGLLAFATLAILISTSLGWLTGGNYAVAPLPWLALGWLDRRRSFPADDAA